MPDQAQELFKYRQPTAEQPLAGHTVLLVEDSRFASEALRLMCLHSGARIRRADTLAAARRHLRTYRPSVLIVDLGLPDGDGSELLTELSQSPSGIDAIIAISGDPVKEGEATTCGAQGFLSKPLNSIAEFQATVLQALPPDQRLNGPRAQPEIDIDPDPLALADDLEFAAMALRRSRDTDSIDYAAAFLAGVARSAEQSELFRAATELRRDEGAEMPEESVIAKVARMAENMVGTKKVV